MHDVRNRLRRNTPNTNVMNAKGWRAYPQNAVRHNDSQYLRCGSGSGLDSNSRLTHWDC